jgi:hypothetical protein
MHGNTLYHRCWRRLETLSSLSTRLGSMKSGNNRGYWMLVDASACDRRINVLESIFRPTSLPRDRAMHS